MDFDLSVLANKNVAVHFSSKEHARIFYDKMKREFPKKTRSWYGPNYSNWQNDDGMCYYPRFHQGNQGMTHGRTKTYIEWGVEIVEFTDLLICSKDLGELMDVGCIEKLFGVEVF